MKYMVYEDGLSFESDSRDAIKHLRDGGKDMVVVTNAKDIVVSAAYRTLTGELKRIPVKKELTFSEWVYQGLR